MINKSFYTWLFFLILGIAFITLLPEKYRVLAITIVVLAGMAYIEKYSGGLTGFTSVLSGQSTQVKATTI